jgi:hypothetical protein
MRLIIATTASLLVAAAALHAAEPRLPTGEKTFLAADKDKDGKLTLAELSPPAERRFLKMDTNGDNAVSREEIETRQRAAMERQLERTLTRMDADNNGTITQAEFDGLLATKFGKADADANGAVTFEEAQAYKLAMRAEMRELYRNQRQQQAAP